MVALRVLTSALAVALFSHETAALKIEPARLQHATKVASEHNVTAPAVTAPAVKDSKSATVAAPTQAQVDQLRARLQTLADGLQGMLASKDGKVAKARIGSGLETFVTELQKVLVETKSIKDTKVAMQKLDAAKNSVGALTSELTGQQEGLMKEQEEQYDSLLLGTLMSHQKEPLAKQLEILNGKDFAHLEVSKALVAKHNAKDPLYQQVAAYLDQHLGKEKETVILAKATKHADIEARAESAANAFQKRVDSMTKVLDSREKMHKKRMHELSAGVNKAPKASKHAMDAMLKREERTFKKWAASQNHDITSMKSAVAAIRSGDLQALGKAKAALESSLKSLQSKNGGFLVLIQLGNELMEQDCPYCAAQCVDTCHSAGKPYTTCLTDCADAGKGK